MSKSVRLSSSDAATGRKKNTKMSASAGATKSHAAFVPSAGSRIGRARVLTGPASARARCALRSRVALRHPPALLEQSVHVAIERGKRRVDREAAANRLLAGLEDLRRDLLPLRHLRERDDALELIAERACITIV